MKILRGVLIRWLTLSIVGLALLAVAAIVGAIVLAQTVGQASAQAAARTATAMLSANIRAESLILTDLVQRHVFPFQPRLEQRVTLEEQIAAQQQSLATLIRQLRDQADPADRTELTQIEQVELKLTGYISQTRYVMATYKSEGAYGPRTYHEAGILISDYQLPLINALRVLEEHETGRALSAQARVQQSINTATAGLLVIGLIVLSATLLMVWQALRRIAMPLATLHAGVEQLRLGQLDQPVRVPWRDELGALADALNTMAAQLQQRVQSERAARQALETLNVELEQRVAERTRELETSHRELETYGQNLAQANAELQQAIAQSERRSRLLTASVQVAHAATLVRDPQTLLTQVTHNISEHFGFYHAGVFLLDEAGEWAVLRAANSEGGREMLARGHKLKVGVQGIVGWTAHTGQPRIALDVGADAVHFDNPFLPHTRSEMALPLKLGERILGVLDVQSTQEAAFSEEDVTVLQAMADQLAVAIENARLFEQTQAALEEAQAAYRRYVLGEWSGYLQARGLLTQEYALHPDLKIGEKPLPEADLVFQQKQTLALPQLPGGDGGTAQAALVAPIKLRDQVIGVLDLRETEQARQWTEDEIALADAVANQVALAVENARLFEEATTRAQELAVLNELAQTLTSRILNVEEVLTEAYRGTSRLLDTRDFYISLYDAQKNLVTFPIEVINGEFTMPYNTQPADQGLTGYLIRTGAPLLLRQTSAERVAELGIGEYIPFGGRPSSQCWLGAPLVAGQQVLGTMAVISYTDSNAFSEHDLSLLTAIANQTAIALQNAYLFEQTRQQIQDLETINRIAQIVTSALNLEQLLSALYEQVSALCATQEFYIALLSPDRSEIWFPAYYERGRAVEVNPLPAGSGLSGHVIQSGQPLLLRTRAELEASKIAYVGTPCCSYLGVPLRAGERLAGVLAVQDYEREHVFTERHLRLLSTLAPQIATAIENTRLFEEAHHRALQLATAAETGKAASSLLDLEQLLSNVVELIRIRFGYYHASVFLMDEAGEYAVLRESTGEVGRQLKEQGHKLAVGSKSLVGWVTSTGRSRVATDTRTDDIHFKNPLLPLTRSELVIPLKRGERVIGALDVQSTEPNAFSPDDVAILEVLADQIAIAIENARMYQAEQRRAARQAALYQVGRQMTGTLDPQALMRLVVEAVQCDLGFERVLVLLVDEPAGEVYAAASSTNFADLIPPGYRQALGQGMIGVAAQSGQTQWSNDTQTAPHYYPLGQWNPRSELCVPLKVGMRVIGVLDVESDAPNAFTEEDVRTLESLADQLAVAMENARLYVAEQQRRRETTAMLEVARIVGQTIEFNKVVMEVALKVAQAVNVDRCTIFMLDETRTLLRPTASQFASGEIDQRLWDKFKALKVERVEDVPLCQQTIRTGRPVVFDRKVNPTSLPSQWYEPFDIQSALAVTLVSKGAPIGIIVMDYCRPRETYQFTPEQIALATAMAAQAAMVIDNARMYEELSQTADRLREMDRLKSQFLANMSHELRTPLNSIIGFSRVILKGIDGPLTDMQRQDLEAIHGSGQHLLGLINDILDISKIEAGKMELAFEEVDLRAIIKGVMSTAIGLVKGRPIDLVQKVSDDLPTVWADPVRSRQILLNLVSNASKFTEKGSITVEAVADARFVRVSVRDTGIGIPQEKLDTIFEAFTQVDASTTRKYGGTGLGLAIARRFVELHGGEIWVESEVGVGTTFSFTLPRAKPLPVPEPTAAPEVGTGKKIVIAIDDDPGVITLYRRYLEQHGYHIIGVSNSEQAVEQVRRFKPHAITLDILMPQKDGWMVLQELKQNPETREIPVVVCSILSEQGRGFSLGAADYLVKPIMQDDLIAALKRLDGRTETRVLVIDDRPEDITLIRRMLETQPQFIITEAHSGAEGIEAVHRDPPDLILLDLMMPGIDGFQVLETLKGDPGTRSIPIVIVTAKTLTQEDLDRLDDHIQAILSKGHFTEKDLLNDVANALARLTGPRE